MFSQVVIYYFTGTGNALASANWIASYANQNEVPATVVKIEKSLKADPSSFSADTLIGFCYPTHGFNAPPIVIDFLLNFPKVKGGKAFILNTRAGMKLSKLFTPGLSGLAQLLPALILWLKGFRIVGLQPMDLPSNWISLHPGIRQKVVDSIFGRCEQKTNRFAEKILSGKKACKGLISLPVDLLISPISAGYYFYGRFMLSKTFIAGSKCNNCGLCIKECPLNAIRMKNNRPFWTWRCESCMHCMNSCPIKAIETPHLFTFVLWWLVCSAIPTAIIYTIANDNIFFERNFGLIFDIVLFITVLPLIFFSYRILHFLMRFKFVSWLIVNTSFTHFKFWRRYSAPKKFLKPKN